MTRAPACAAMEAVTSVLPLSTTMHSARRCHGISATTWPMDSASFKAGMMVGVGGGIRFFFSYQTKKRRLLGMRLSEAGVDGGLGVVGSGGGLYGSLLVCFEGWGRTY